ncbi:helix-turn-helix domain-containing protein [Alteromonas sediminis]|uniref:Helix-turn-helix domain-containing protein n=1 Tax=Alteromonas sediminis TaxID=2259342 RepID=A0A3N5Y777_9ALTE|nr:cupin domain-containing protein [Alteromonas sediminis]RPJ66549.1 helix-turn-helix domain-containing protein [Alteromonas sediminis]
MDNIANILRRISIKAEVFFSGKLCGIQTFDSKDKGHLHLLRAGTLTILMNNGQKIVATGPSLIFIPSPHEHRILSDQSSTAQLVCATVNIDTVHRSLLLDALPSIFCLSLDELRDFGRTAEWLFEEAFGHSIARQVIIDKLSEIFLLQLLRYSLERNIVKSGTLAALTHPMLAKVISAMHEHPEVNWTVESLADMAAMSRSKFAATFKSVIGLTPNDYLTDIRISLAQDMLLEDKPVNLVANQVGYEHGSALARIFRKKLGLSPREWLKSLQKEDFKTPFQSLADSTIEH